MKISMSQINTVGFMDKIKETLSPVATTGKWEDLKDKPLSMYAQGGNASFINGFSDVDFVKVNNITKFNSEGLPVDSVDFYVNPISGVDEDNLGNELQPFKTIKFALSKIPQFVNILYNVNIITESDNQTVNESIKLSGRYGPGGITIKTLQKDSDFTDYQSIKDKTILNLTGDHVISSNSLLSGITLSKIRLTKFNAPFLLKNNFCPITIEKMYTMDESSMPSFKVVNNIRLSFFKCFMEKNITSHIEAFDSNISLIECKFDFCEKPYSMERGEVYETRVEK